MAELALGSFRNSQSPIANSQVRQIAFSIRSVRFVHLYATPRIAVCFRYRLLAIGYRLLRNEPKASSAYHFTCWNRSATASAFARELKAETRKKPSPWAPNPAPGVITTWISFKSLSKTAQLPNPDGALTHM